MPRVVFDPAVSSIVVDLLLEAADGRSSLVIPVVLHAPLHTNLTLISRYKP
jgi:hypothetical protein